MSSPTDFYLTVLDNDINVLKALISADDASADTKILPKLCAKLDVHVADVRDIFQFSTNSVDLTDISSEDMYFFVDANKFRDLPVSTDAYNVAVNGSPVPGSLTDELLVDQIGRAYVHDPKHPDGAKPKQGIDFENDVKSNAYTVDNKGMIKDLFRDLANQMFNTQYGVDIFSNETDLCNNVYTSTSDLLKPSGAIWEALNDASGLHYELETPNQEANIGQILFENIVTNDVERLQTLDSNDYVSTQDMNTDNNAAGDGAAAQNNSEMRMYKMPFIVGDSIRFHLTYKYHEDQSAVVGAAGAYEDRIYEVILNIVA